jgi:hypothetical protein
LAFGTEKCVKILVFQLWKAVLFQPVQFCKIVSCTAKPITSSANQSLTTFASFCPGILSNPDSVAIPNRLLLCLRRRYQQVFAGELFETLEV